MGEGPPKRIVGGRWEIQRPIGRGGMGAVYLARHLLTQEPAALKVLYPDEPRSESLRERFLREARAPAEIQHPGIARVLDAGVDESDGSLYLAMELLQGESLRDRLARPGLSSRRALELVLELLDPLAAAHSKGFVHRDLKPENAFVARSADGRERVMLLDFGIARRPGVITVTDVATVMGTAVYTSPEQTKSARSASPAADVWSIGVLLYRILAGRLPFEGDVVQVYVGAASKPHPPLTSVVHDIDPALSDLVDRCLAKAPADRPQDAAAVRDALRKVLAQAPQGAQAAEGGLLPPLGTSEDSLVTSEHPSQKARRARRRLLGLAIGAAGLAALIVWAGLDRDDRRAERLGTAPPAMVRAVGSSPTPAPSRAPKPMPPAVPIAVEQAPSAPPLPDPIAESSTPEVEEPVPTPARDRRRQPESPPRPMPDRFSGVAPAPGATGECLPITNAKKARCYVDRTGGVVAGESGLRNLIVAYHLLGERSRVRSLGNQYLVSFPASSFVTRVRQLME